MIIMYVNGIMHAKWMGQPYIDFLVTTSNSITSVAKAGPKLLLCKGITKFKLELYRAHTPCALQRRCQRTPYQQPVDDLYPHIVPGCAHEQKAYSG